MELNNIIYNKNIHNKVIVNVKPERMYTMYLDDKNVKLSLYKNISHEIPFTINKKRTYDDKLKLSVKINNYDHFIQDNDYISIVCKWGKH
ncbi:hypothetical protein AGMMS49579_01280 [Spirochaetia bacterium]|nr:hypothetical protein AGMMS49579_01280 [Spirochaetia bacterium]